MPEMHFSIRWPDGAEEACYSPSSAIADYLIPNTTYALADFLDLSRLGLQRASERVRQVHGFPCSRAAAQLARIESRAQEFTNDITAEVTCLSLT